MLRKEKVAQITEKFGKGPKDTGSPEVQIALLTERITSLAPHFSQNNHDYHSKTGLMKMIGRRRRLLRYLSGVDNDRYLKVIKELGLRK